MSTSNAVPNVLGSFGGQLGLVNTGMGMNDADGTFNVSSTLQGLAATAESQFALAGKSYGPFKRAVSWSTAAPNSTASRAVTGAINVRQSEVQSTVHRPTNCTSRRSNS